MSLDHPLSHLFRRRSSDPAEIVQQKRGRRKRQDDQPPPRALIRCFAHFHTIREYDKTDTWEQDVFFYFTKTDEVFWSCTKRPFRRLAGWKGALKRIPDHTIYPRAPKSAHLTIAPEDAVASNPELFHVKRPNLWFYEEHPDLPWRWQLLLAETFVLEALAGSKAQLPAHPNIIRYHGCRVYRGYITAIVLERLEYDLEQYVKKVGSRMIDKQSFLAKLRSAVDYMHSLGLAHNDIKPKNIMVREIPDGPPEPVLVDFGSCAPFGCRVWNGGTPGWFEEDFNTSAKTHDTYSLGKLEEWLDNLETAGSKEES
jgi:serine/threonine protein kinase